MLSRTQTVAIVTVTVIASLAGGLYYGYQRGGSDSNQQFKPIIDQLTQKLANATAENDVLSKKMPSLSGKTVTIGYIAPVTDPYNVTSSFTYFNEIPVYTTAKPFIEKVIQPDINAYARNLGIDVQFEFLLMDAKGQANTHLELVQQLHAGGVDIFIGAGWSSQACSAMSYVNVNKMLMVSPSSTSPSCAVANDRFYRMCPADGSLGPALVKIIWSYGIKEVVILQRGDSYADGITNTFVPEYAKLGGFSQMIRYPAEAASDYDFCPILQEGRDLAQEAIARMGGDTGRVGVLLIAYDEAARIIQQASQCDVLYNLVWFGSDSVAKSPYVSANAPMQANHLKLFSPLATEPDSTKYNDLRGRCMNATGREFTVYYAYLYDSALALARAIIETGSDNATKATAALPEICENTYGASGWLKLNKFGDRFQPPYTIWYYAQGTTSLSDSHVAGTFRTDTNETTWNTRTSDYTVRGPTDSIILELVQPRVVTDKQTYQVGETIYYRLEFYNPNQVPVTFQPPKRIEFLEGYLGEELGFSYYDVPANTSVVTIPPEGVFYQLTWMCGVSAERVGFYEIRYGESVAIVDIKR